MKNGYNRKQRQLSSASRKLVKFSNIKNLTAWHKREIQAIKNKIWLLVNELKAFLSTQRIKKLIGSAAILLGISFSSPASAQISFGPAQTTPFDLDFTGYNLFPELADMDGDGDYDMLMANFYDGSFSYFENTGTAEIAFFEKELINPFGLDLSVYISSPAIVDIDNDGDLDLFAISYYSNINYFENIGDNTTPIFSAPVPNTFGIVPVHYFANINFVDIDNDGDYDLIISDYQYSSEKWTFQLFENEGSAESPMFVNIGTVMEGIENIEYIAVGEFADIDGDGDLDLMNIDYDPILETTYFSFYENVGTAENYEFTLAIKNPFDLDPLPVYLASNAIADLDNDGDLDILLVGADADNSTAQYFENLSDPLAIDELSFKSQIQIFPNPSSNYIKLQTETKVEYITIHDLLGKEILHNRGNELIVDVSNLQSGLYILSCYFQDGTKSSQNFVKE